MAMARTNPRCGPGPCALLAAIAALAVIGGGCGYSLRAPFDESIRTVYVPIFRSFSFRDDLNIRLQEELIKEIENRTTYRVVDSPEKADTILSGTVLYAQKFNAVVSPNNLPRQLFADLTIEVSWEDLRNPTDPDKEPPKVTLTQTVPFFPEPGETAFLAYQEAIRRAAVDIVNMMEEPW
ncbi:LPS assembly lipoprotein LptE [Tautonia rosea]|uniref:LPS assembly lipoprotein LptE n=1 Tax=Tautonia rosea TaxID=2728037 RepID=UPI0014741035|nr:LPS assembly lipoprotein LptE [Tautonia rosea]